MKSSQRFALVGTQHWCQFVMATSNKWQFSEEEIRTKLEELGYNNIPDKALKEFSNDLHRLMTAENAKEATHHRDRISSTTSVSKTPASIYSDHSSADERVVYTTMSPYNGDHDESDLRQSPVTQHHRLQGYSLTDKENQTDPTSSKATQKQNKSHIKTNPTSSKATQKRKVLRKRNGEVHVFDESFSQENATDISDIEKRFQRLPLKDDATDVESIGDDDMSERLSVLQPWGRNRNVLPSFIRPRTTDSRSKGIRKTDPVSRYHQFKLEWSSNKVPGEKMHKSLRWSTREQMLQYESFEKPRHTYVPNNYVAPTQKKRQALRWEVRSTLANC